MAHTTAILPKIVPPLEGMLLTRLGYNSKVVLLQKTEEKCTRNYCTVNQESVWHMLQGLNRRGETLFPQWLLPRCGDTHEGCKCTRLFHGLPCFLEQHVLNFVVTYFRGWPRPQKISKQIILHKRFCTQKFPKYSNSSDNHPGKGLTGNPSIGRRAVGDRGRTKLELAALYHTYHICLSGSSQCEI